MAYCRLIALIFLCVTTIYHSSLWSQNGCIISEQEYFIPLQAIEAGHNFADLEPLKQVFQDVRVIALGEATHGTREFFQFKHRLLEFLVLEMRCRLFAIEDGYGHCQAINNYVLGIGSRDDFLPGQSWLIYDNSQEIVDMIDWMRAYNQTVEASEKVQFVGFDCQLNEKAGQTFVNLLKEGDPDYYETSLSLLAPLEKPFAILLANEQERAQITVQVQEVFDHVIAHTREWQGSTQDYEQARFLIRLLKQQCEHFSAGPFIRIVQFVTNEHPELITILEEQGVFAFLEEEMQLEYPELHQIAQDIHHQLCMRDSFMSENIMTLLHNLPKTDRMVVWAHNGHIALDESGEGIPAMGSYLRGKLGQSYYALGFVTSSGTFQAFDPTNYQLTTFSIPPQPEHSWAHFCREFKEERFIFDFRSFPPIDWMSSSLPLITLGTTFSDSWPSPYFLINYIPLNHFDGLVYIRETSAARPHDTAPI